MLYLSFPALDRGAFPSHSFFYNKTRIKALEMHQPNTRIMHPKDIQVDYAIIIYSKLG